MRRRALKAGRRWLILGHRWLGIGTGAFLALWIGSGLVMLYVPFPSLTEEARIARLPALAGGAIAVAPDAALAAAGLSAPPPAFGLEMRGSEPVYRIVAGDGRPATISAVTGARLPSSPPEEALRLAGGVPGRAQLTLVERDQWTVTARYDPLRPFHKVALGDEAGTEIYVSRPTGAVALVTTRFERGWNWVGAVTHWIYLTPLRSRAELWRDVVLWLSGIAALGAASGLVVGVWRLRLRARYPGGAVTPYRGLARWHHLSGLAGGLTLVTFVVSGWLSMNPNRWFSSRSPPAALHAAHAGEGTMPGIDAASLRGLVLPGSVALRFVRVGGRWFVTATGPQTRRSTRLDGTDGPDTAEIAAAAAGIVAGGTLRSTEPLVAADAYWPPRSAPGPLPVLRLRYDDPAATWLHIDPRDGAILSRLDRSGRINRWLFDGLHRLDLPPLSGRPGSMAAMQWLLNGLGGLVALTGLVAGWRRLTRGRPLRSPKDPATGAPG